MSAPVELGDRMSADALIEGLRIDVERYCHYPVRSVLLIGSRAEGLANAASDIDLVGVVHDPGRGRFRVRELPFEYAGQPGSILYVTERGLRRRLASLDRIYRAGGHLTDGLATRLANARVVYDTDSTGAALVDLARRYTPSPETFREMARVSLGFLHDALGSRAVGDHATAVLMARAAAAVAVDCFLLRRNERNLKPKWHLRRLQRAGAPEVLQSYLRVLGVEETDAAISTRAVEETQQLLCAVLRVQDLGSFSRSELFAAPPAAAPGSAEEGCS